jgi:hypothetical protein
VSTDEQGQRSMRFTACPLPGSQHRCANLNSSHLRAAWTTKAKDFLCARRNQVDRAQSRYPNLHPKALLPMAFMSWPKRLHLLGQGWEVEVPRISSNVDILQGLLSYLISAVPMLPLCPTSLCHSRSAGAEHPHLRNRKLLSTWRR